MAFPVSPTNGQTAVVNNITYQFSNVGNTWTRILSTANIITANTVVSNGLISAVGNVVGNYILGNGSQLTGISINPSNIASGTSNVQIVSAGGNATVNIGGTSNVAVFATTGEYITGILSASGNVTGGNILTAGAISATGTLSVTGATTLGTASTGNLSSGNISTGGLVSATANVVGGNILTGGVISAASTITGTSHLGAVVSVTANVTGGNLLTGGLISSTGTITGSSHLGTVVSVTANITGGNVLTGGLISATANVTGGNILTAGQISATGTVTSNGSTNSTAFAVGNSAVSNVALGMFPTAGTSGEYAIRDYSNVFTHMYLDVGMGGTANGAFQFRTSNAFRLLANINSTGLTTPLAVSATGNVTGNYFIGNGSQLTGVTATTTSIVNGTSNVVVAASGNVTVGVAGTAAVATFTTAGIVSNSVATTNNGAGTNFKVGDDVWLGDVNTADTMSIRGQQNAANGYVVFGNADATTKLGRAGSGPLTYDAAFSAVGNVTGGNLLTSGLVSAAGTVTGTSHLGSVVSVTANVTGGNLLTGGLVSATGSITSAGNLSLTGNIVDAGEMWINTTANGNINLNPNGTGQTNIPAGILSVTGNIQGGNLRTAGLISATANVTGGNILTGGLISSTGTITGSSHLGTVVSVTANVTGGNILTGGLISATSTITSAANVAGLNITTSGNMVATGNVSGGNVAATTTVFSFGTVQGTGNVTGGNLLTAGLISATGNITGGNVNTSVLRPLSGALTISTVAGNLNLSPTTGNIVVNSTYINGVSNPVQDQDVATKAYVDNFATTGISYHQAVTAATTTTLATTTSGTITYTQPNGAANGVGALLQTTGAFNLIDTANVQTLGTRILVKNEANAVFNGIYTWSNATAIVRATDADEYGANSATQFSINDYFFVTSGNVNAGAAYIVDAPTGTITFGTSNIAFAQFSSSQTYTANTGAGITLVGTVISAKVDGVTTAFDGGGNISVKASANLTTPNIGAATGTSLSTTGNVTGGNLLTAGLISATSTITSAANVTGGNVLTGGLVSATANVTGGNIRTAGIISATGNITGGNANITGTTAATSKTTGALVVGGGIGVASDVWAGNSVTVDGGVYGNVVATQFAGLFATAAGANPYSIVQVRSNDSTTGMGMQAYANLNGLVYSNTGITFQTGATIRDKDYPTGGATRVTIDSTGLVANGIVSASGNVTGGNILTAGQISATGNITGNYYIGNGAFLTGLSAGTADKIANGATNINIPVASGNIAMSVAGQANTVVINLGSLTMYGTFAGPKSLSANVSVADGVNALLLGPVTIGAGYHIDVPDTSTLYAYAP